MRKLILSLAVIALVVVACQETTDELSPQQKVEVDMSDFYLYTDDNYAAKGEQGVDEKCFTMQVLNRKLQEDPGLYQRMYNVEKHTREWIAAKKPDGTPGGGNGGGGNGGGDDGGGGGGGDGGYVDMPITDWNAITGNTIPVIIHVIYNKDSENIPDSQLDEQILALIEDFSGENPNDHKIPDEFAGLEANLGVSFEIAGVKRVKSRKKSWRPDDSMKFTSSGGSDVHDPEHYLNIWVVNNMPYMGGNILGYAQFPDGGAWATDGIVLDHRFVGNTSYSTGRTATHEIGHWMNLRHIWGDGNCNQDDFVTDTPDSDRYNSGCPTGPVVHCGSNDMYMNFMDYTSDNCMSLFTVGQAARMGAVFADGGVREAMNISIN